MVHRKHYLKITEMSKLRLGGETERTESAKKRKICCRTRNELQLFVDGYGTL